MPNPRVRAQQTIASLIATFEANIDNGLWQSGAKLPTERELEAQLGVSRNTLRNGLRRLEAEGRIVRHVGRGSFVAPSRSRLNPNAMPDSGADLIARISGASPVEIMEVRLMIEPAAVELSAGRASAADLDRMETCLARMNSAKDIPEYESWDGQLHVTIVTSAKNELMSALYEAINATRAQPEWELLKRRSATPERRLVYQDQHSAIVAALRQRDGQAARAQMIEHLILVRQNMLTS